MIFIVKPPSANVIAPKKVFAKKLLGIFIALFQSAPG